MKKVLVIGMLDSIHLSRWLSQFEDQPIVFTIYPSTKFRSIHPDLLRLVNSNKNFYFTQKRLISLFGHKEFFFNKFLSRVFTGFSSAERLAKLIERFEFDYIHALEIQGAGYLLLDSKFENSNKTRKIIVTNWGSDIYYFEKNLADKLRIQQVLKLADYYSAECHRDYELALKNGFSGKFLPLNPNAGGFKEDLRQRNTKNADTRNLIVVKCYGGNFGLGELIVSAIENFLIGNKDLSVLFYSVTLDLESKLKAMVKKYPDRVSFATVRNKLSPSEMYEIFMNAKIYIGASKSDGISTSFLEALVLGAYPIQTNTSCGGEWAEKGFCAHLIDPNEGAILEALKEVVEFTNLEEMRLHNKALASKYLDFENIKAESIKFYGLS
jgi:hypothetical protein